MSESTNMSPNDVEIYAKMYAWMKKYAVKQLGKSMKLRDIAKENREGISERRRDLLSKRIERDNKWRERRVIRMANLVDILPEPYVVNRAEASAICMELMHFFYIYIDKPCFSDLKILLFEEKFDYGDEPYLALQEVDSPLLPYMERYQFRRDEWEYQAEYEDEKYKAYLKE